jgi:alkylhydroperoxidase/carboxymuconolactone decarboxylase family protein YurZ
MSKARVKLIDPQSAVGEIREIYDDIERVRGKGKIAPIFMALANVPEYLKAHWEYNRADKRTGSRITNRTKEMISIVVSVALGCRG